MFKNVDQKFDEVKVEFEATGQKINRLVQKQGQLAGQFTRLNLVRQIQNHHVARTTPPWIVNDHHKLVVNSSTS